MDLGQIIMGMILASVFITFIIMLIKIRKSKKKEKAKYK
jgi:hypothetical protein